MSASAADVLRHAAALVRRGLARGFCARDEAGRSCQPLSPLAASWSVPAALERAVHDLGAGVRAHDRADVTLRRVLGDPINLVSWSDSVPQAEAVAALERAATTAAQEVDDD